MKNKNQSGITLVALVVTIIILLILAGVTISQISGDKGLFSRVRQAVEGYKNAQIDEESKLTEVEKYLSEFEILGGDKTDDGVKVKIVNFEATPEGKNIKAVVTIEGESSEIQFSLDGEEWVNNENNINNTEYTFNEVKIGSYNVRVKVYDEEGKKTEAMSKLITVVDESITLAEEDDVLATKTYYDGNRELHTGKMDDHGGNNIEVEGNETPIPKGYYDGTGKITGSTFNKILISEYTSGSNNDWLYDIKKVLPNKYSELSEDNFFADLYNIYVYTVGSASINYKVDIVKKYDKTSGILSITYASPGAFNSWQSCSNYHLYCIY